MRRRRIGLDSATVRACVWSGLLPLRRIHAPVGPVQPSSPENKAPSDEDRQWQRQHTFQKAHFRVFPRARERKGFKGWGSKMTKRKSQSSSVRRRPCEKFCLIGRRENPYTRSRPVHPLYPTQGQILTSQNQVSLFQALGFRGPSKDPPKSTPPDHTSNFDKTASVS